MNACPCGSGKDLDACCGPVLAGAPAPTAEALMRSRYTAYTKGAVDHILSTYTPKAAASVDRASTEKWSKESTWLGLSIVATDRGGPEDDEGTVEFIARFREGPAGQEQAHHEKARFVRGGRDRRWLYADGKMVGPPPARREDRPGRNDPCHCGSGKKFKKCHGAASA
ncbi:MAG: SEC-C domain-containing protein [Planctomycetes bacterium]|nr:SEC-C domain-containing protein [Planctomycetota bacterium]